MGNILRNRKPMGRAGVAIFFAVAAVGLIMSLFQGCEKLVVFDDSVTYTGSPSPSPSVVDTIRCAVTPAGGVIGRGDVLVETPSVTLRVVVGAELLYTAAYSIDGEDVRSTSGIRLKTDSRLDLTGYCGEGMHTVTGVLTNGVARQKFTAAYKVVRDTTRTAE